MKKLIAGLLSAALLICTVPASAFAGSGSENSSELHIGTPISVTFSSNDPERFNITPETDGVYSFYSTNSTLYVDAYLYPVLTPSEPSTRSEKSTGEGYSFYLAEYLHAGTTYCLEVVSTEYDDPCGTLVLNSSAETCDVLQTGVDVSGVVPARSAHLYSFIPEASGMYSFDFIKGRNVSWFLLPASSHDSLYAPGGVGNDQEKISEYFIAGTEYIFGIYNSTTQEASFTIKSKGLPITELTENAPPVSAADPYCIFASFVPDESGYYAVSCFGEYSYPDMTVKTVCGDTVKSIHFGGYVGSFSKTLYLNAGEKNIICLQYASAPISVSIKKTTLPELTLDSPVDFFLSEVCDTAEYLFTSTETGFYAINTNAYYRVFTILYVYNESEDRYDICTNVWGMMSPLNTCYFIAGQKYKIQFVSTDSYNSITAEINKIQDVALTPDTPANVEQGMHLYTFIPSVSGEYSFFSGIEGTSEDFNADAGLYALIDNQLSEIAVGYDCVLGYSFSFTAELTAGEKYYLWVKQSNWNREDTVTVSATYDERSEIGYDVFELSLGENTVFSCGSPEYYSFVAPTDGSYTFKPIIDPKYTFTADFFICNGGHIMDCLDVRESITGEVTLYFHRGDEIIMTVFENSSNMTFYITDSSPLFNWDTANTTVAFILESVVSDGGEPQVFNRNGELLSTTDTVFTGCKLVVDGEPYTVVVSGDVNGDGKIGTADFLRVRDAYLGKISLIGEYDAAARVSGKNSISTADFLMIRDCYLGKINSFTRPVA